MREEKLMHPEDFFPPFWGKDAFCYPVSCHFRAPVHPSGLQGDSEMQSGKCTLRSKERSVEVRGPIPATGQDTDEG